MAGTAVAVGCAVGIPSFIAACVAFAFFVKTRRRLRQEDLEYVKHETADVDKDISFDNLDQLRMDHKEHLVLPPSSTEPSEVSGSDDGRLHSDKKQQQQIQQRQDDDTDGEEIIAQNNQNSQRKKRYVPAYKKKLRLSATNVNNSRSSSYTNLNQPATSNSSINSTNTAGTDNFYGNVPVLDDPANSSAKNSVDLARSLQQPTPSYSKRSNTNSPREQRNRSPSFSTSQQLTDDEYDTSRDYDLKNNYNLDNEHEIQEEDQYENEFTNYTENKRAYIESLRPKAI